MAGCYGNSPEDRARERQLDAYLDSQEIPTCSSCGELIDEDNDCMDDPTVCQVCHDLAKEAELCDYCGHPLPESANGDSAYCTNCNTLDDE